MNPKIINLILAGTNLLGFIPFSKAYKRRPKMYQNDSRNKFLELTLIGSSMIGSTLMHLTETKHGLPGLFLQQYSNHFLWLDRITAVSIGTYVCYRMYKKRKLLNAENIATGVVGLILGFLSEKVVTNQTAFMILHSLWHGFAYVLIDKVI
jgi:hypothetical protein